jgi:hypothetical protein
MVKVHLRVKNEIAPQRGHGFEWTRSRAAIPSEHTRVGARIEPLPSTHGQLDRHQSSSLARSIVGSHSPDRGRRRAKSGLAVNGWYRQNVNEFGWVRNVASRIAAGPSALDPDEWECLLDE